jgi:hypothetical protein
MDQSHLQASRLLSMYSKIILFGASGFTGAPFAYLRFKTDCLNP